MIRAALIYWAAIFALGFLLGTVRVLWLAPAIGAVPATLCELPVMLGASAIVARHLLRMFAISRRAEALGLGLVAFALLLASELLLTLALGSTARAWLAGFTSPAGLVGLAGQVLFGMLPVLLTQGHPQAVHTP